MAKQLDQCTTLPIQSDITITGDNLAPLLKALTAYFDLMYSCDTAHFDEVFLQSAHLHGYRDGDMVSWSAPVYRAILEKRQSPKSLGAPRLQEVLLVDGVSTNMALVKVRVRINKMVFVDHLIWHRFGTNWLITAKGFHLESEDLATDAVSFTEKNSSIP